VKATLLTAIILLLSSDGYSSGGNRLCIVRGKGRKGMLAHSPNPLMQQVRPLSFCWGAVMATLQTATIPPLCVFCWGTCVKGEGTPLTVIIPPLYVVAGGAVKGGATLLTVIIPPLLLSDGWSSSGNCIG